MIVNSQPFLTSAARTTDGQSNGYRVDGFFEGNFLITVTACTGTLTITPQISFNDSDYFVMSSITPLSITTTGNYALSCGNFGKYLKAVYTISGGSVTFAIEFMGKDV